MGSSFSSCIEPGPAFALFQAVRSGDLRVIKFRLDLEPELLTYRNLADRDTVWHVAAAACPPEVLEALEAHASELPALESPKAKLRGAEQPPVALAGVEARPPRLPGSREALVAALNLRNDRNQVGGARARKGLDALFEQDGVGSAAPALPRLAKLAAAAVRQQLLADIELAEGVVREFRSRNPRGSSPTNMIRNQSPFIRFSDPSALTRQPPPRRGPTLLGRCSSEAGAGVPPQALRAGLGAAAEVAKRSAEPQQEQQEGQRQQLQQRRRQQEQQREQQQQQPQPPRASTDSGPSSSAAAAIPAAAPQAAFAAGCCALREPSPFVRRSAGYPVDSLYSQGPLLPVTQCAICLDDTYCLVSEPCHHRLCSGCARDVVLRAAAMPLVCPICRLMVLQLTSPVC
ncbi:hypothetical protein TSOC_004193 [Tetrabaena socialis]|uniref:RING-type domain-containing protein n=1 Tax=Tetrabaena socialis TaxID=47790 RepID=A0A2J8A9L5_9CHLO|nr:hypothetical protein TSOC_004193 [Tetrabaena socialis]|eukprot:PNH09209.1 hypothetical protein TSOC_004193 [Tetrabaena socialis]